MKMVTELKNRFLIAWHVLRGKPVICKVHFEDGISLPPDNQDVLITGCLWSLNPQPRRGEATRVSAAQIKRFVGLYGGHNENQNNSADYSDKS